MHINEVTTGDRIELKGTLGTVTRVTRCRVFVLLDDGSRLPEIVSPRAIKPAPIELTAEHVDSEPVVMLAGEATKPPVIRETLTVPQQMWLTACSLRGTQGAARRWQSLDYLAAACGIVATCGLHLLIASI